MTRRIEQRLDNSTHDRPAAIKGRGAVSNASGRFESHQRESFDDGWDIPLDDSRPQTQVQEDTTRSVLTFNQSPLLVCDSR